MSPGKSSKKKKNSSEDAAGKVSGDFSISDALNEKAAGSEAETFEEAGIPISGNSHLRRLMNSNFMEYASYVIKDRAIPDVDDGLKPVQRRILWSLFRLDDGKFHKVANVIGHSMQFHPHGDASIYEALVNLANKDYFIDKQGNFGHKLTGDPASAARYIECRLTPLAKEVLFNRDITEFEDSYDGRNKEPVVLPAKVPVLLMCGGEGIAVGMSTRILPHNFKELLEAQISILREQSFEVYPDFFNGGLMDVSEYDEGNGKVTVRAKIDIEGRKLLIREIPFATTTERLISSIENAARRNKIKISSINDFTTEKAEIEITPARGYAPEKALKALYAYTDCSMSIGATLTVIADGQPVQMTVKEVLRRNTDKLLGYLKRELEIELGKLNDAFHEKSLAQIFIENRIYKRIEECEEYGAILKEVRKGLSRFKSSLKRKIVDEDIEKLLAIPIRRISLFDINKNKKDIEGIVEDIDSVEKKLKRLRSHAIKYLNTLIKKYSEAFPRRTVIDSFDRIDVKKVALNNIKIAWDRKNCYVGTSVRSDDNIKCNEFDKLLCIQRSGSYRIINIPDKLYVGRLCYFNKHDKKQVFGVIYSDKKTGKHYAKKVKISSFILDKEYRLCPKGCRLELITSRVNSIYECVFESGKRRVVKSLEYDLSEAPERSPKARGGLISPKKVLNLKFVGYSNEESDAVEESGSNAEKKKAGEPKPESPAKNTERKNKNTAKPEKRKKGAPPADDARPGVSQPELF